MKGKSLDRLVGHYCKIVAKEPGDERSYVISGVVKTIDHDEGFVMIESPQGFGYLNLKTIVAIKPRQVPNH